MIPAGLNSLLLKQTPPDIIGYIRTLGGSSNDYYLSAEVDSSGNVYAVGHTKSFPSSSQKAILTKFDTDGNHQFSVTLNLGTGQEIYNDIALDGSNNIFVVGSSTSGGTSGILSKFNNSGTHIFTKSISGGSDVLNGVTTDGSGNVYVAGFRQSGAPFGSVDGIVCKFNNSGTTIFTRIFGGTGNDKFHRLAISPNGNIIVLGSTRSPVPNEQALLVIMTSGASINITKRFGPGTNQGDIYADLVIDSSNNIFISGWTSNFGVGDLDGLLTKFSGTGSQSFNIAVGGGSLADSYTSIAIDGSGNLFTVGSTKDFGAPSAKADAWLSKFNSTGTHQFSKIIRETGSGGSEVFRGMGIDSLDNLYAVGSSNSDVFDNLGSNDALVIKFNSLGVITPCPFIQSVIPTITNIGTAANTIGFSEANFSPVIATISPTIVTIAPTINTVCN